MALDDTDRQMIEDCIYECQLSVDRYLASQKATHAKILRYNIEQCMEILEEYKEDLRDDTESDKYRLHLLVPFQVNELIKMREKYDQ